MSANITTFSKPVDTEIKDVREQISELNEQIGALGLYKSTPYTGTKADSSALATITLPAGKYVCWACGKSGEYGGYLLHSDSSGIGYVNVLESFTLTAQETIRVAPATTNTTWELYYVCFLRIA